MGKLPNNMEPLFNGISTLNPVLEDLDVHCALRPSELLPLVSNVQKLGNLAKLALSFGKEFLDDTKSLSVLDYLRSCPLLAEVTLRVFSYESLKMPSALFSSLEPLLVNKLKAITLESIVLNSSAAEALSHSLQSPHCSLVTLTLHICLFVSDAFKQLAIGIGRNTSLHSIRFSNCQLGSTDVKILADVLRDNKTLKEADIKQSSKAVIDEAEIQALKLCNQNIAFKVSHYPMFVTHDFRTDQMTLV